MLTYVQATTKILRTALLTSLQLHENEVMRAYKTVNDLYIEPISFTVPRRAETFQGDIFPPCTGSKPAMSASEWLNGKTALPPKIDLESKYEGNAPVEVAADYKPPAAAPAPTPAPAAKPAPKPEPEPVARAAPPSVSQQKGSMAAAASKFQDDEDDKEDEAETSSFEEVQKPVSRAALPVRSEPKSQPPAQAKPPSPIKASAPFAASSSARSPQPSPALSQSGSGSGHVEASLEQIKQLIEAQTKIITAQGDKITAQGEAMAHLTGEVETLKKRVVSGGQDQSERIRQLELELEEARS